MLEETRPRPGWSRRGAGAGDPGGAVAPRRPTMVDVANEARVSQTTVSLVLNHADGARLSAETRKRVVEAAARLGYRPGRRLGAPAAASAASIGFVWHFSTLAESGPPASFRGFE